jgi:hypothetical protein
MTYEVSNRLHVSFSLSLPRVSGAFQMKNAIEKLTLSNRKIGQVERPIVAILFECDCNCI